jgi:predicted metal-dependent phosphoesterase TrpH
MVQRLNDLGLDLSFDMVLEKAGQGVIGRPHVAEALAGSGAIETYEQAFQKYIGKNGPAYVPKAYFTPEEAIEMVHNAGGVTVLAHPAVDDTARFTERLAAMGLDGIEAHHPFHRQSDADRFRHLAERFRLITTGGSDFHGREGRNGDIGSQPVRIDVLDRLQQRAQHYRGTP